jgi:Flp pilus assembly protein TadG
MRPLAQLGRNQRGVALVEFAIVAPILLLLYLSGYVMFDALTASRKVAITARTVADLTARYSSVTTSDMATIMGASTQVLWPYSATNATIRVSEVQVTSSTSATVVWGQAQNTTARAANSNVTIPANLGNTGSYMILGEVTYAYTAPVSFRGFKAMNLAQTIYMNPRVSNAIPLS